MKVTYRTGLWDVELAWYSSCDTHQSIAPESTLLSLSDLAWSVKFLRLERNILNHLITVLWTTVPSFFTNIFSCFRDVTAQFELIKNKFSLHVHLCGIQIIHGVTQCTTCQHTNYHHTTNHSRYLLRFELLRSRDYTLYILARYQKIEKLLNRPCTFGKLMQPNTYTMTKVNENSHPKKYCFYAIVYFMARNAWKLRDFYVYIPIK